VVVLAGDGRSSAAGRATSLDGTPLMQKVFSPNAPILSFNSLADQSDRDEQKGHLDRNFKRPGVNT
jgi:Protein of unknown function (Hypoth_ymh)